MQLPRRASCVVEERPAKTYAASAAMGRSSCTAHSPRLFFLIRVEEKKRQEKRGVVLGQRAQRD